MDATQALLALIRVAVCGAQADEQLKIACTPELLEQVYTLAARHDLAHLAGQGASRLGLPDSEPMQKCRQAAMMALYRYTRLSREYQMVCQALEEAEIPFIPLKGSVLRDSYPEPWMRTSCDMDILVHEADLDAATQCLTERLNYVNRGKSGHDVALQAPGGDCLELHYTMIEDFVSPRSQTILDSIWTDARPLPGKKFHLEISDGLFYYYHMIHMAKHVINGGCGIRTFLDVWILNNRVSHDRQARCALLEQGGLTAFAQAAEQLSRIWFDGEARDPLSGQLEQFVLSGGTYGTMTNRVTLNRTKEGGKLRYVLSRIFLPYDVIKYEYPVLQKHKWLTPGCEVIRWFRLVFGKGLRRGALEMKAAATDSQSKGDTARQLLDYLGLEQI